MTTTNEQTYLDFAASTPLKLEVVEAMQPYFSDEFYNPSAIYLSARRVRKHIDEARSSVAQIIGARTDEIIFTAGATESCNLAIKGIMNSYPDGEVLTSAIEHDAVLKPAADYQTQQIDVDQHGFIKTSDLKAIITDNTVLVSSMYANNEVGVIQKLSDISKIIQEIRRDRKQRSITTPLWLHSDAAQAGNYLDLHVSRLGVDLLTLNGSKIYGPKQSGILYVRAGVTLRPMIDGGGQELGLRSGTENVPGIFGFTKALDLAQSARKDEAHRLAQLQKQFIDQASSKWPDMLVNGPTKHRLPNNINVSFPELDGERLVMMLDERGFQVATGAACSALSDESSHVLKALGRSETEAKGSLRISMGATTTDEDISRLIAALNDILSENKS